MIFQQIKSSYSFRIDQLLLALPSLILFFSLSVLFIPPVFSSSSVLSKNSYAGYFKQSYEDSRTQFRQQIMKLKQVPNLRVSPSIFASTLAGDLTTDVAWIQSSKNNRNLKVIISGIHGIEGYVGSALQSWMMENKVVSDSSFDYLFIHALNPYGFKNNRRVNENNIDLNRNFVTDQKTFVSKNLAYEQINNFLNPEIPLELGFFSRTKFIFSALQLLMQSSLETLRHAILLGQYEYPNGIYFGGSTAQYQTEIIKNLHQNIMIHYKNVFVVDLHTGYGEKNKLHLLANSQNQPSAAELIRIFSKNRIDFGDTKNFYQVSGDLLTFLENKSTALCQIRGIAFEFGTLDSQTTLGSMESLRRLILENQLFHFQTKDTTAADTAARLFGNLFYPTDPDFKRMVIEQANIELDKITTP